MRLRSMSGCRNSPISQRTLNVSGWLKKNSMKTMSVDFLSTFAHLRRNCMEMAVCFLLVFFNGNERKIVVKEKKISGRNYKSGILYPNAPLQSASAFHHQCIYHLLKFAQNKLCSLAHVQNQQS